MSLINKELTISEISDRKSEVEKEIARLLRELEQATGLEIMGVEVKSYYDDVPGRKLVKHALIVYEDIDL